MDNTANSSAMNRIKQLLDEKSFVEIGAKITSRNTDFNLQSEETPADGVVTGYGTVFGRLVYVYSQDSAVLGGSVGEMHAKKIVNLYKMARKVGAPIVGLIDCAGLRLQEATDALHAFGTLYMNQTLTSGIVPQISALFGVCGGGMAIVPALSDFSFMESKSAKLFVNSPNALENNSADKNNTATAAYQSAQTGLVDRIGDEATILSEIQTLLSILPDHYKDGTIVEECNDDLNRLCDTLAGALKDPAIALSLISDQNFFFEVKKEYAKEMVAGFIKLNGMTIGAVANRSALYSAEGEMAEQFNTALTTKGCEKAADFVRFCDAFDIPVLSLTDVSGYEATIESENGIAKASAKLVYAFANATIPKVNIITGEAIGTAALAMNSKAIGADLTFAYETSKFGMMDGNLAARIMYEKELQENENPATLLNEKANAYNELQLSAASAARRGYVDEIIEIMDTRKKAIAAFEMLYTKQEKHPNKKHGTV